MPSFLAWNGISSSLAIDDSFARTMLRFLDQPTLRLRRHLVEHPALDALLRHRRLMDSPGPNPDSFLDRVIEQASRAARTLSVADYWASGEQDLGTWIEAAAWCLPAGARFGGTVHLVVGYDLGVAAPPDIALNVTHPHFLANPTELGFYALHEAHHVGFFAVRPIPKLGDLHDPAQLQALVGYMAQLEGMAVHAAYPLRASTGHLEADPDYLLYTSASERQRVVDRYQALLDPLRARERLSDAEVGRVLEAMSSGERTWYRFGALVSWTLERQFGREALVASIARPEAFARTAGALVAGLDAL